MHFDYDSYNKLFPREEVKPPVIESPVETFKPTPKAVEPVVETKTEVTEVPKDDEEKKEEE